MAAGVFWQRPAAQSLPAATQWARIEFSTYTTASGKHCLARAALGQSKKLQPGQHLDLRFPATAFSCLES